MNDHAPGPAEDPDGDLSDGDLSDADLALLRDLAAALDPTGPPDGLVDRAAQLILLRDLDADLADLAESADLTGVDEQVGGAEPVGARGPADAAVAGLTFVVADGAATVEVSPGSPGPGGRPALDGMILCASLPDTVFLDGPAGNLASTTPDVVGGFTFADLPAGPLSLRFQVAGRTVRTTWFLL